MIQAPRGTKDILPSEIDKWHNVEDKFRKVTRLFGYQELRTPIFESTEVFSRSIGDNTDIVKKEMYTFMDKGENSITLRPEMTAALVRSVIQSNITARDTLQRLWYFGPFFRYERPQKGRFRQFHQFGAECLATPFPESDVEVLLLAITLLKELGITQFNLGINSLGNKVSREAYLKELVAYLTENKDSLSEESKVRLEKNPLRVLDSKYEQDLAIIKNAPSIENFYDEESKSHFDTVKNQLTALNINFSINPNLVRGLDYYSHTVFEFQSNALGSQDAFGGGGRYNELFEDLGGKITPSVGFAFGVERLLLIIDALNQTPVENSIDIYIATLGLEYQSYANQIANIYRSKGNSVITDLQRRSFKSQLKEANSRYNAKYTVIVGEEEFKNNSFQLKNMNTGEQKLMNLDNIETILID